MPLNAKGKKIMAAMNREYGTKAKQVFYASKNKGTISGVERKRLDRTAERSFFKSQYSK